VCSERPPKISTGARAVEEDVEVLIEYPWSMALKNCPCSTRLYQTPLASWIAIFPVEDPEIYIPPAPESPGVVFPVTMNTLMPRVRPGICALVIADTVIYISRRVCNPPSIRS
jgi:hypothetical protein